jgi:hypothetical protein
MSETRPPVEAGATDVRVWVAIGRRRTTMHAAPVAGTGVTACCGRSTTTGQTVSEAHAVETWDARRCPKWAPVDGSARADGGVVGVLRRLAGLVDAGAVLPTRLEIALRADTPEAAQDAAAVLAAEFGEAAVRVDGPVVRVDLAVPAVEETGAAASEPGGPAAEAETSAPAAAETAGGSDDDGGAVVMGGRLRRLAGLLEAGTVTARPVEVRVDEAAAELLAGLGAVVDDDGAVVRLVDPQPPADGGHPEPPEPPAAQVDQAGPEQPARPEEPEPDPVVELAVEGARAAAGDMRHPLIGALVALDEEGLLLAEPASGSDPAGLAAQLIGWLREIGALR